MNFHRCLIIVLAFNKLIFILPTLSGQDTPTRLEQTFNLVQSKYGDDQAFVNGIYFDNIYKNDLGTPFFNSQDYQSGYIVLHNKKYSDLLFKYNAYNQKLIVAYTNQKGRHMVFMPPTDFISEFFLNGLIFRKYTFPGSSEKFFQVVYNGDFKCLYSWQIDRIESTHNISFMAHKFLDAKRKSYLVIDNNLHIYRSKASFIKLFPEEHIKSISAFMKKNKIKIKRSPDKKIAELVAYCESLSEYNHTPHLVDKE